MERRRGGEMWRTRGREDERLRLEKRRREGEEWRWGGERRGEEAKRRRGGKDEVRWRRIEDER